MFDFETFELMTHICSCILAAAIIFKELSLGTNGWIAKFKEFVEIAKYITCF